MWDYRFIALSDWHLRTSKPVGRADDFYSAQLRKLSQLVEWAKRYDCPIFAAGDIFDSPQIGWRLFDAVVDILNGVTVVATFGQHDIYNHVPNIDGTPFKGLKRVGALEHGEVINIGDMRVCTCGWAEKPKEPVDGCVNILLAHIPVFKEQVPFYFKDAAYTTKTIKQKYPGFDWYLCGDIHSPFVADNVVVSGSMMRLSKDQENYKPRAYLVNNGDVKPLYFDIEPDVFKLANTFDVDTSKIVNKLKGTNTRNLLDFKKLCLDTVSNSRKSLMLEVFNET